MMPLSLVCSPVAVTSTRSEPSPLMVAATTSSPSRFFTGLDSPEIIASFEGCSPLRGDPVHRERRVAWPHQHQIAVAERADLDLLLPGACDPAWLCPEELGQWPGGPLGLIDGAASRSSALGSMIATSVASSTP